MDNTTMSKTLLGRRILAKFSLNGKEATAVIIPNKHIRGKFSLVLNSSFYNLELKPYALRKTKEKTFNYHFTIKNFKKAIAELYSTSQAFKFELNRLLCGFTVLRNPEDDDTIIPRSSESAGLTIALTHILGPQYGYVDKLKISWRTHWSLDALFDEIGSLAQYSGHPKYHAFTIVV